MRLEDPSRRIMVEVVAPQVVVIDVPVVVDEPAGEPQLQPEPQPQPQA